MGCKLGVCFVEPPPAARAPLSQLRPSGLRGPMLRSRSARPAPPARALPPAEPVAEAAPAPEPLPTLPAVVPLAPVFRHALRPASGLGLGAAPLRAAPARPAVSPALIRYCVDLYGDLPEGARLAINERFAGLPRGSADAAWCEAVQAAYEAAYGSAEVASGPIAPAGRYVEYLYSTPAECTAAHGTWDAAARQCNMEGTQGPGPISGANRTFATAAACREAGGNVYEYGAKSYCGTESWGPVEIGATSPAPEGPDHTEAIVGGVVSGVLGIAAVVASLINRGSDQEFRQFQAQLMAESQRLSTQARAGDAQAAIELARVNAAAEASRAAAAEANARAAAAGRPPPFSLGGVPTWAVVTGLGLLAALGIGGVALAMRPPAPVYAPQLPAAR